MISKTDFIGVPKNIGVKTKFQITILTTFAKMPNINDNIIVYLLFNFLNVNPDTITKVPVENICMNIPIIPLDALTVMPCIIDTIKVKNKPFCIPNEKVAIKIGISAGSYSKNEAKIGILIAYTSKIDIADKILSIDIFFIFNNKNHL